MYLNNAPERGFPAALQASFIELTRSLISLSSKPKRFAPNDEQLEAVQRLCDTRDALSRPTPVIWVCWNRTQRGRTKFFVQRHLGRQAGMAELADAADSKSAEGNLMGVRFPLPAPIKSMLYQKSTSSDAFLFPKCAQTYPTQIRHPEGYGTGVPGLKCTSGEERHWTRRAYGTRREVPA